jgi:hypothetical protein
MRPASRYMGRIWLIADALLIALALAGCTTVGTPQRLVGRYFATITAPGQRETSSSLVLGSNGTFDFPDLRGFNGKVFLSGRWSESDGSVTMTCSDGIACSSAHDIELEAHELGRNLGSPARPGTYRLGGRGVGSWYAVRK